MNKKHLFLTLPILSILLVSCSNINNDDSGLGEVIFDPANYEEEVHFDESQSYLREGVKTYNFYNFNDFHGATEYISENGEPGIAYISSFLKDKKATAEENNEGFIFTNSGDMWQGSADSNITRGRLVIDWLNSLSCLAMAIGNHEFDWGRETIENNVDLMDFPLLACNIIDKSTNQIVDYAKPFTTATVNGLNIGFIGSIGSSLKSSILLDNVRDVDFIDPVKHIQQSSTYLKENGADLIVLLSHDSYSGTEVTPYVDIIFNGHTHTFDNSKINGIPSLQAYCNGRAVAYVKLSYDFSSSSLTYNYTDVIGLGTLNYSYEQDEDTLTLYQRYLDNEINAIKNQVAGNISSNMSKSQVIQNLLTLINYYYVDNWKNEYNNVCYVTHNNARADIPAGQVTYGMIYKALPFDNYICLIKLPTSDARLFKNICEYSLYIDESKANDKYVYALTIDYIAQKYETNYDMTIVKTFEMFPRDIFFEYFSRLS
ncbi:MAG: bifunctional metallophosphatase/5'-nucleotidase [Bacilli bacterium]